MLHIYNLQIGNVHFYQEIMGGGGGGVRRCTRVSAVPVICLSAWNKLLIGHTLWAFSWRDALEIESERGHAEIYSYLRVARSFISILGSCLQYVFWLMLKALARMRGVGRKNTKTSCCIDDYNLNVPKLKLEQVLKNGHPTGPLVQYRLKPAEQCEPQVCHTSN